MYKTLHPTQYCKGKRERKINWKRLTCTEYVETFIFLLLFPKQCRITTIFM